MLLIGYILTLLMGLSLGLIGGGGSILTVPILVYFFSIDPLMATSESLFIVGTTALIGGIFSYMNKEVKILTAFKFALSSFIGVFIMKKYLLPTIPLVLYQTDKFTFTKSMMTMSLFAGLMLIVSIKMIRTKSKRIVDNDSNKNNQLKISSQGFIVGNLTGLIGAGGGFLIVPALVNLMGLNMRQAIGSSLLIIAANSLFGFTIAITNGLTPDWSVLILILSISIFGLFLGRFFSKKISDENLKKGFGYFVLIIGSIILVDQILKIIN